jgi:hypothetical protein
VSDNEVDVCFDSLLAKLVHIALQFFALFNLVQAVDITALDHQEDYVGDAHG